MLCRRSGRCISAPKTQSWRSMMADSRTSSRSFTTGSVFFCFSLLVLEGEGMIWCQPWRPYPLPLVVVMPKFIDWLINTFRFSLLSNPSFFLSPLLAPHTTHSSLPFSSIKHLQEQVRGSQDLVWTQIDWRHGCLCPQILWRLCLGLQELRRWRRFRYRRSRFVPQSSCPPLSL